MTRQEFEQIQRRLEEARRDGLELVETAYQAQMRALAAVWRLQGDLAAEAPLAAAPMTAAPVAPELAPVPPSQPPPPPAPRKRRPGGEVKEELRTIYPQLPETFERADINALLGYKPERGALYRALAELSTQGFLTIEPALGQTPAVYHKVGTGLPPDD